MGQTYSVFTTWTGWKLSMNGNHTVKNSCNLCWCTFEKFANNFVNQVFYNTLCNYLTISKYDKSSLFFLQTVCWTYLITCRTCKRKYLQNNLFIKHNTGQQRKKRSRNGYLFCFYKLYYIRFWFPFLLELDSFCKKLFWTFQNHHIQHF